ncbi:hypothetical protein R6Q57_018815 [Mikania cordata]
MARGLGTSVVLMLVFTTVWATDHSPLQDFCVADLNNQVLVNGITCKNPSCVQANDFYYSGMHVKGNTSNAMGSMNLVHYQRNVGNTYAVAMVALSSQNPGVIPVGNAIFCSKPDISTDILAKAFQVREDVISNIQTKF